MGGQSSGLPAGCGAGSAYWCQVLVCFGKGMKRVLLGAYYFPPMAGVGWMRAAKFAKYLPDAGWQVRVATVDPRYYAEQSHLLAAQEVAPGVIDRLAYHAWMPLMFIKLVYPLFVVLVTWRHRREIDAVVLFGSPFYPFLWTPVLRWLLDVPVVVDFRDGWSSVHAQQSGWRSRWLNPLRRFIERRALRNACAGVFATDVLREQYAMQFPAQARHLVTITNGYDPEDFCTLTATSGKSADHQRLVIAGKFLFYTPEAGRHLIRAVCQRPGVRLKYMGEEAAQFRTLVTELNAGDQVEISDSLSYPEVLGQVSQADLCVVSTASREGLGTKIFDYLALGKPVFALVPPNSELAIQFGHLPSICLCESPRTEIEVGKALEQALTLKGENPEVALAGFDRAAKAKKLAGVLDRCQVNVRGSAG